ncbi:hypothetical protein CFP56_030324 [Quercus suber]|uniref:RNase H type-1 domain-containing protein n=1 Tax=Quercus suber TaxID=58331 RepID=A0AAW0JNM3_QUESU
MSPLFLSFVDLFWLALQNSRGAELFITLCWFLWTRRNKSRVKEAVMLLEKLSDLAQQYLQEFQQLHGKSAIKQPPKQTIWKSPDSSTLKTNFDDAIFEDLDAIGIGVVVQNSSGEVLAALSEIIPLPSSIVALETIAAQRAVIFLQELGLGSSIFEGDSETSILAIKSQCFHHSLVGHLIKDIMSSVSSLNYFSFSHTCRQGNGLAYALARRARFSFPILVWMESVPSSIHKHFISNFLAIK